MLPSDPDYDIGRRAWNGMVDKRPAIIAYCAGPEDVIRCVTFARTADLPFSVRAGGHNIVGSSVCEGGLVIDVSRMKAVAVDARRRTARIGAGLNLGELDAATQAHGLATTMGVNSDTGVSGLTLGGGFGKMARKHGLACDNLLAADVVTADGRLVRASESENPDLFWGLRGGGGNFGVVTAFEFRLHPLGPQVLRARLVYERARARDALLAYDELCRDAPDEISADAGLSISAAGEPQFGVSACFIGPIEDGRRALARALEPLKARVAPNDEAMEATRYLDIQSAGDATFPRGRRYYWKAQFLDEISEPAADALLEGFARAPSPLSVYVFQQVGGAIARVAPGATAYVHRRAALDTFPAAIWLSPEDDAANIAWARDLWSALRPFSSGAVYVNNLGEEGGERVRAAYGDNYARLAALKTKYDPDNVFRLNQNIHPQG